MNTCATCKHWSLPDPEAFFNPHVDKVPADDFQRWGSCDLIELPTYKADPVDLPAYVQDGSDYRATLYCRDDFGCTLHEPKG